MQVIGASQGWAVLLPPTRLRVDKRDVIHSRTMERHVLAKAQHLSSGIPHVLLESPFSIARRATICGIAHLHLARDDHGQGQ
jgi:hypothetical protein